jgi:hypothetical protein
VIVRAAGGGCFPATVVPGPLPCRRVEWFLTVLLTWVIPSSGSDGACLVGPKKGGGIQREVPSPP